MARNSKVSQTIYRHHLRLNRFLNDAWIFTTLTRPMLKEKGDALVASKSKRKLEYPVPKKGDTVISERRDEDVGALFLAQYGRGIFDTHIISIISRIEAFIQDCIFEVVKKYPEKLAIIGGKSGIPLDLYLQHEDRDDLLEAYIALRCQDLMFSKPSEYLAKAAEVLSIQLKPDIVATYVEMKASRDLLIHNGGLINQLYLDKAGRKARGKINDELDIDEEYFADVIMNAKMLSGAIQRETEKKYR
ncbi:MULTISPECIES: hypothetical protein [unclassified Bradyrhizobium]|uniref:hypothetical protein n=1 Tax=unclassified Bradyrhizobium TaxID=2631580 RepID=UPI0028ED447C|nr:MULTISPECIES: hypothetical protein [unclassified Bradyrhizobium]